MKTSEIVNVALDLFKVNSENDGFIPDYALKELSDKYGITYERCRKIRDIVQKHVPASKRKHK